MVLTKLLYASPVWLSNNTDIFKCFISRALLKITGAQFHPAKHISHIMLGILPLDLINQHVTIKFLLKCLAGTDDVTACILQIESTPGHRYFRHICAVKEFLKYKHEHLQDQRLSQIQLCNLQPKEFVYLKNEVLMYICRKWDTELINNMELICNKDTYKIDNEIAFNELKVFIGSFGAITNSIFQRTSKRIEDTQIADFLHGHCLRFQDFAFAIERADPSIHIPICIECGLLPDSPFHQIMECDHFDSQFRSSLQQYLGHYEINFHIPLLFNQVMDSEEHLQILARIVGVNILLTDASAARANFRKQVHYICKSSFFSDQRLAIEPKICHMLCSLRKTET